MVTLSQSLFIMISKECYQIQAKCYPQKLWTRKTALKFCVFHLCDKFKNHFQIISGAYSSFQKDFLPSKFLDLCICSQGNCSSVICCCITSHKNRYLKTSYFSQISKKLLEQLITYTKPSHNELKFNLMQNFSLSPG
jgi:hypothetical protein